MRFKIDYDAKGDIPNNFIYKYLNTSNPTYFSIYLYIFRRVFNGDEFIDFGEVSLEMEFVTENDVINTFKYFEKKDIIKTENDKIVFLEIIDEVKKVVEEENKDFSIEIEKPPTYDMREIEYYRENNKDVKNLFMVAEKSFGRTLKASDIFIIFDIYDRLLMKVDVIEYLLEYYASKGTNNMNYILKAAVTWQENGVKTKDDAIKYVNRASEDYILVRKALGNVSKGERTNAESIMLDKFYNEYNYSLDIILEACDAANMSSHNPSYNYLEGILNNWYNEGIKTVEDVKKRSLEIEANRNKPKKTKKSVSKNKFANFSQKGVDFDKFEKSNQQRLERLAKGEDV